ncbi:MAG: c-type cytochrome [Thermodesulfobacteriota bacterium]
MKYLLAVVISVGFLAAGCAGRQTPLPAADSAAVHLYESKCGQCHSVPHPRRYRAEQWEQTMRNMVKEMELKGVKPLTEAEKVAILDYLREQGR